MRSVMTDLTTAGIVTVTAHRVSTMEACDRIAVVEHGRITAMAAPADLPGLSPYFREALASSGERGA